MKQFKILIQEQFSKMCKTGKLFRSSVSGQEIWDLYLKSFKKEDDPVFRDPNSSTHNCNYCNNFIRRYGNVIAIDDDLNIITMFDVEPDDEYLESAKRISDILKKSIVSNIFQEKFSDLKVLSFESVNKTLDTFALGIDKNVKRYTKLEAELYGVVKPNEIRTFEHFSLKLPKEFVSHEASSIESIMGIFRDAKNVFKRAMDEIPYEILELVRDLITQGSLLDGQTHLHKIEKLLPLKSEYDSIDTDKKDNWCWVNSYNLPYAKFKNELIGVLCTDIASGVDLNTACQLWNKRVDPKNYMKTVAPITNKQIEDAKKFVEENGYTESFNRRFATIDDIKASEILHINVGTGDIKSLSIFDNIKSSKVSKKKYQFDDIEEVPIETFMKDILPRCKSVEAFLSHRHTGNLVSLTTSNVKDSKPIFKWSNNYSWTFNGNLAGKSQIKEAVKIAGGRVDGVLRFSLIWNDVTTTDSSDLDAWCIQPGGERIGYNTEFRRDRGGNRFSSCGGQLDLDNTNPGGKMAIENIYFTGIKKLKNGTYDFKVHQYSARNSQGFKAEIEFDGSTYTYEYNKPVSGYVNVAEVTFKDGVFTIKHELPITNSVSEEIYGLRTEQFHKVNLVCLSPNHWADNNTGNKHYLFMLDGCKAETSLRTFHTENLIPELAVHRKVLEVLGNTTMVHPTDNQLSGLGFNATVKDELILKLEGTTKKMIKVIF